MKSVSGRGHTPAVRTAAASPYVRDVEKLPNGRRARPADRL